MLLHETLKKLRKENNLLQKDIANHLQLGDSFVAQVEAGKRHHTYSNLNKILKLCNVDKKTELDILKEFFLIRLSDDLFECNQRIQEIVNNEMTRIEIESEVAKTRDQEGDFDLYKNEGLTAVITFLKNMEPDRREKALSMFLKTSKLPIDKFVTFLELFNLLIDEFDNQQLKTILAMAQLINK